METNVSLEKKQIVETSVLLEYNMHFFFEREYYAFYIHEFVV